MLAGRLRSIFRRETNPVSPGAHLADSPSKEAAPSVLAASSADRRSIKTEGSPTRQSRGLEQFFFNIRDVVGLSILDCAGANQNNIDFLINLGHKVYSQDLVRNLDEAFGPDLAEQ